MRTEFPLFYYSNLILACHILECAYSVIRNDFFVHADNRFGKFKQRFLYLKFAVGLTCFLLYL